MTAPPSATFVAGEPGIGKSRLLSELLADRRLRGSRVLLGRCHPLREPFPLGPVADALRSAGDLALDHLRPPLVAALRQLVPELADPPQRPVNPSIGLEATDPRTQRHLLFRALLELFARPGPTVLVLDDLHWADELTVEFLGFLSAQSPPHLSLVLTYRREDLPPTSPLIGLAARWSPAGRRATIELGPLTPAGVREVVAAILGADDVSQELADYLHERTSGIPFAVEEVVQLIQDRRDIIKRDGRWLRSELPALSVPPAVRDAVLERVARLPADSRQLVEAAAVADVPLSEPALVRLSALEDGTGSALSGSLLAAVIVEVEPGRYSFRHALARQAVYDSIPRPARRNLHRRAAEVLSLDENPPPALVAHHYREAGHPEESLRWAEDAARRATSVWDDAVAARLLAVTLQSPGLRPPDRARVALELGKSACRGFVCRDEAVASLEGMLDAEDLPSDQRGEMRWLLGILQLMGGDGSGGCEQLTRSLAELGERPELAARAMMNLANPWARRGHESEHLRWLERGMELAQGLRDEPLQLQVLTTRATILVGIGDASGWSAAEEIPWDLPTAPASRLLYWACVNLATAAFDLGQYARARALLDDAAERLVALGTAPVIATAEAEEDELMLAWGRGDWEGLETRARRHIDETVDFPVATLRARRMLGHLALARGRLDEAERSFRSLRDLAVEVGKVSEMANASAGIASVLLARGDSRAALGEGLKGLDIIEEKGIWTWGCEVVPAVVEAMIASGQVEDATALVHTFSTGLEGRDSPHAAAARDLCWALVSSASDARDAAHLLLRAEHAFDRLPRPYDAARVRARRGRQLLAKGDHEGESCLAEAIAAFQAMGATGDVARLNRDLPGRSLPQRRWWKGGRKGYGDRLSPREHEVAELASRGRTNAEIAEALFLSQKTVEKHMTAVIGKLGLSSRRALLHH